MAVNVQILRKIGACENKQAQTDWSGPAIDPCPAPAAFLCETCGRMLCGSHAGGHWHPAADGAAMASHFQDEAKQACDREAAAEVNAATIRTQLAEAQKASGKLDQIRELLTS